MPASPGRLRGDSHGRGWERDGLAIKGDGARAFLGADAVTQGRDPAAEQVAGDVLIEEAEPGLLLSAGTGPGAPDRCHRVGGKSVSVGLQDRSHRQLLLQAGSVQVVLARFLFVAALQPLTQPVEIDHWYVSLSSAYLPGTVPSLEGR